MFARKLDGFAPVSTAHVREHDRRIDVASLATMLLSEANDPRRKRASVPALAERRCSVCSPKRHSRSEEMSCRAHHGQKLHDAAPCIGAALHDATPGVGAAPAARWPPASAPSGDGVVACCPAGCAVQGAGGAAAGGPDADWPPAGAAQAVPAAHATGGPVGCCHEALPVQDCGFPLDPHEAPPSP